MATGSDRAKERGDHDLAPDAPRQARELFRRIGDTWSDGATRVKLAQIHQLRDKEIARLLSASLRNVASHRYSIRKNLGLPSDADLSSHPVGLGTLQ